MAHPLLFITSLGMIISHFIALYLFKGPLILQWSYISGPSTSIWNHGLISSFALWSDRIMMTAGCLIDLYFMETLPWGNKIIVLVTTSAAIICFFIAKVMSGFEIPSKLLRFSEIQWIPSLFHASSHVFISISHYCMLSFIQSQSRSHTDEDSIVLQFIVITIGIMPLIAFLLTKSDTIPNVLVDDPGTFK